MIIYYIYQDNEDLDALVKDNKEFLINNFRETRELKNVYAHISQNKVILIFHDVYIYKFTSTNKN